MTDDTSPSILQRMSRKKNVKDIMAEMNSIEINNEDTPKLKKCLTKWDVVFYGVGSTVGAGIFVITGQGALSAGPAIVLSFFISALCCLFSAFSYAEFASRCPVSGSAYTFTYVALGEFAAWFVGWNLTLEYAISAAAVARGFSSNFSLFLTQMNIDAYWLTDLYFGPTFPDVSLMAGLLCAVCTGILLIGVKESAAVNKAVTFINIGCIMFIVTYGSFFINTDNWHVTSKDHPIPDGCSGSLKGFFPCGINGLMTGAAKVFFSFIGFDSVTTLAEEVSDPQHDIPFGVISTLAIASTLYVSASLVLTGMVPWNGIDKNAALATAFNDVGRNWAATLIAVVSLTALSVNTLCSLFGQPRIFFRMAKDGLLFKIFSEVHPTTQTPFWGTIITGVSAGLISMFVPLDTLSNMIAIGTLMAFTTVCLGVVLLRYEDPVERPNYMIYLLIFYIFAACGMAASLTNTDTCPVWVYPILAVCMLAPMILISRLNVVNIQLLYACPWVPFIPLFGTFFNIYLIASLDYWSYVRVLVWTIVGMMIYFFYGIFHSKLNVQSPYVGYKAISA